jgi:hypothetical protein
MPNLMIVLSMPDEDAPMLGQNGLHTWCKIVGH